jgi:hypothetical protein
MGETEACLNDILVRDYDYLGGFVSFYSTRVKVYKAVMQQMEDRITFLMGGKDVPLGNGD